MPYNNTDIINKAIAEILHNQCVVFPTETVYGLGADAGNKVAVQKIFELKNRPAVNPLIVHIADRTQIDDIAEAPNTLEKELFSLFSPGPLTVILKKKIHIPNEVSGGLDTIGVRIPNHPIALAFLQAVQKPICAPSANISGKPSPTTFAMAKFYMEHKVNVIIDGGDLDIGIESTVVKVENNKIYILRSGTITSQMIFDATGINPILSSSKHAHQSPGTRFSHYKPSAKVITFESGQLPTVGSNSAVIYLTGNPDLPSFIRSKKCSSLKEYARILYREFFLCDQESISTIYCELPPNDQEGIAIRDRLVRASENL
ncbi:MAG: L-threonylcarbamoyladenylate synthase [Brevinemataceae bacterium]